MSGGGGKLYGTRKEIVSGGAEMIFTDGRGWDALTRERAPGEKPFIVLLYGPPGSGKSSALARQVMTEGLGLNIDSAASISLDALMENLVPFRRATAALYRDAVEKSVEDPVVALAGKAGAVYLDYMGRTGNNSVNPENKQKKGGPLPDLLTVRNLCFEEAIRRDIDILFEMVISDGNKDKFGTEIFQRLKDAGKLDKYDVYVIYPWVRHDILEDRLRMRPLRHMEEKEPYFRVVSPKMAGRFIDWHREYMKNFIFPRVEAENVIGYRLLGGGAVPNSVNAGLIGRIKKVIIFNNTAAIGGRRHRRATKKRRVTKRQTRRRLHA